MNFSPEALALPRLGAIAIAVLGAAFEAKGLGGDAPLENWVKKHLADKRVVTFAALKHRDEAQRADEAKRTKARKQARRNSAHKLRVARFEKREAS